MDRQTKVAAAPDVLVSEVGPEVVLLNPAANAYVGLDDIGGRLWALLVEARSVEPQSVEQLCDRVQQEFDGDPHQVSRDVIDFLQVLEQHGLVSVQT